MKLLKLIPDRTNIDFVGVRFYAFAIDGLLVLISILSLALHGLNYGIDFTGGVLLEVKAPQILDRSLWEKTGHWENYRENMFVTESEKRLYAIKPMNCPCHVQVYNQGLKSYRDLPLRLAELFRVHFVRRNG